MQITSSGFQFLLHTPHAQLWDLLLQYLEMVEVKTKNICAYTQSSLIPSCISGKTDGSCGSYQFSIHAVYNGTWPREGLLSRRISQFVHIWTYQEYSTESLSETQKAMLEDLRDYGLIWQRKVGSSLLEISIQPTWL